MKKIIFFVFNFCLFLTIVSCGESEEFESWEKEGYSPSEDISISSSASDNATVTFGQSYQHQVTTTGTYSGTITYSLSNQPDGMTISSSGLIEWTPTKASQITTHSNITITLTTASGYVITQTYDLTVTGTCTSGNVMAIWTGDQRTSTDSSKFLGNITAYTDNATDNKTPEENYGYTRSGSNQFSVNKTFGPTASAGKGSLFFYNEHDNSSYIFLFYYFGEKDSSEENEVDIDVLTSKNNSASYDVVDDDDSIPSTTTGGETKRITQETSTLDNGSVQYSSKYTGRYAYNGNSDGAVIGPFSGSEFRIFVDIGGTSTIDNSTTLTLSGAVSYTHLTLPTSDLV